MSIKQQYTSNEMKETFKKLMKDLENYKDNLRQNNSVEIIKNIPKRYIPNLVGMKLTNVNSNITIWLLLFSKCVSM